MFLCTYHVRNTADGLGIEHDDLGGHVTLHGLRHVLHGAVDGRVLDLEPVVSIPTDQEPHVLLPVKLLLEHLQGGGVEGREERQGPSVVLVKGSKAFRAGSKY